MSTRFDSAQVVKAASFGRGVHRSKPTHRSPFTASDCDQHLAMKASEPDWDRMAYEAAALDRMERGLDA